MQDSARLIFLATGLLASVTALPLPARDSSAAPPRQSFEIPAWAFDRGNARTFTNQYADAGPMVAFGGQSPVVLEYDIDFPAAGNYRLALRYAAATARPVNLHLDGKRIAQVCRSATGSWMTSGAAWEDSLTFYTGQGRHTLRLQRAGDFPHLMSLRFESEVIPAGFLANRPTARKLNDPPPARLFEPWVPSVDPAALRLAIRDLMESCGTRYPQGPALLQELEKLETALGHAEAASLARSNLVELQREALVRRNPLLEFRWLLTIRRSTQGPDLGLPYNWQSNSSLPKDGYDDTLVLLDLFDERAAIETFYRPQRSGFIGDVDLHWDATRLLFSAVGTNRHWQVFELALTPGQPPRAAATPRQLTGDQPDVDYYDACYLPDDRILFTSTASFVGVPCVYGSSHVANLYRMNADGSGIRQLCFDQEHDWCPAVLNNGRVLYTRWEYADTPHSNTRLLFHMNPDGTGQMEYLGSGSYWPNSFFYARPIPGHPTRVVAIIGGHHDNPRMGELVLFDPALGRHEASPAVQRIPGRGRPVQALIRDGLTLSSWPKFLHPFPLNEHFFLAACKPEPDAPWGVYLVDVFDNLVPIRQLPDYALFEPVPLRATPRPPVIPDKVNLARQDATVVIQDIYAGDGLKGVPRGVVRALRLFTYHFAYQNMGGLLGVVGADGPWDIKRVLGTVPVRADGSAHFTVPANTPISLQPLDAEGKAVQLMRSWMTAMPGEVVQCTGCHERQNTAPLTQTGAALSRAPAEITPWHGPVRGFSYAREVQPVIDRHCVGCHNPDWRGPAGQQAADLRGSVRLTNWSSVTPGNGGDRAGRFSVGYAELHRYVRRNGIEGDYHVLEPMEFHADTTELVQLLRRGHYGVRLDAEEWDRLITWIDLNCPYHGTWGEEIDNPGRQRERRRDLLKLYANVDDDPEAIPAPAIQPPMASSAPVITPPTPRRIVVPGWPFDANEAARRQAEAGTVTRRRIPLGQGHFLEMVLIPPGSYVMGDASEAAGDLPRAARVEKAFWMAARETDNQTYALFDSAHDSRVEDKNTYQFGIHGYPANRPEQPVVRVSWREAMAFCQWLSARTGERFTLPTEEQWEWACRAGADTPFYFGTLDADFSPYANLADAKLSEFASDPYTVDVPLKNPTPYDDWIPKDPRFNDGALLAVAPGRYRPNAWGLLDMHGNVAEWTRSEELSTNTGGPRKVVRGGSWRDRPARATASFRVAYYDWQRVYNVGIRVISEGPEKTLAQGPLTPRTAD